jgi:hypothetical protein
MKQKSKKIIAKEILILSSIIVISLITYGILHLWKNHKQETFENLKKQEISLSNKIREKENKFDADYGIIVKNPNIELRKLYEKINQKYDVGTFDEYITKMYKSDKREILYQGVKKDCDLGTFEEFEENLGFNNVYETPNGSKVKATELMDKYGKRFDTLLDQKYLTPIKHQNIIQLKESQLTSNKKFDFEQIEQIKNERIDIADKIKNSNHSIDINNLFYSIIIGLLILAYPFRLFIIGIKWALKNVRN